MNPKLIKTEKEYNEAINALEVIGDKEDFEENENLIAQFELISKLIQLYEEEHAPIVKGHPIDIILLKMEYMGLKQKDLVPLIGSSGVVSEVLNKKRSMSKRMIRAFSELLKIDQEVLNTPYELITDAHIGRKTIALRYRQLSTQFRFVDTAITHGFKQHVKECGMLIPIC
ncbi:hypothetical protein [Chitinophaga caseinilytica]|uniref:HTH-type transcriptional regulator/antitoxin HigA n=1 Tax=Chitinophaga caseinilytica TaxID=2267521 RepID=A0ABZ2Z5S3_9BACT